VRLYLKGERCLTPKCGIEKRAYAPGEHTQTRARSRHVRRRVSAYGLQLAEKQKLRRAYGVLERQFRRYFDEAEHRPGITGETLLQLLERRLDNVVYRLGFAGSRAQARQLVTHGHVAVNDGPVDVPSFLVKANQTVSIREKSRSLPPIVQAIEKAGGRRIPVWLQIEADSMRGRVLALPARAEIDTQVQEGLVVEFYSR
jgi:small subunit ribosomal protein S4